MASTSLSLGAHWEGFIRGQVESGRYGSASEVVRDALRELEARQDRLSALRAHLDKGAAEASRGAFIDGFNMEGIIAAADGTE